MIKRREFIAGLGSAAVWPVMGRAQQPAVPVIGFLSGGSPGGYAPMVAAFRQGLRILALRDQRQDFASSCPCAPFAMCEVYIFCEQAVFL